MLYVFSVNYFDLFLFFNATKENDIMGRHFIEKLKTLYISSHNKYIKNKHNSTTTFVICFNLYLRNCLRYDAKHL